MVTTRPPKTIVKPTALGPVANTDTKLLIYDLFQKGRVLAQDGVNCAAGVCQSIRLEAVRDSIRDYLIGAWHDAIVSDVLFKASRRFLQPAPSATSSERAIDHHGGNRTDSQAVRAWCFRN